MNMFGKTLQIGIASAALLLASGCDKPKEEECRRAVENILRLTGDGVVEAGHLCTGG